MRITLFLFILLGNINLFSQDYYSDRLFIKVKGEFKNSFTLDNDQKVTKLFSKTKVIGILPVSKHPLLSSTYEIVFEKEIILDSLILQLLQLEQIEYAEKVPIYKLFFTPNDPLYSTQWNLSKIQADLAWNLSQGCTNVKVAVTDDGFLLTHEDLINQWHINPGEIAGNGIDDDANGYIDDWRGWDAANNDNDPSATAPTNSFFTHGTHVAGIIAGQTHNSKGIAAIGYNCKMIPVKIGLSPNSSLTGAFQGLDYAINASGCDVVNMSWGGGGWSATYQTLFNIAKAKGIICVAAAGNSNTSTPMYPASYNHVISVAASASTDARASFSNFGSTIDVTAPGVGIPSCLAGATNAYGNLSGTSMASPLVAGLCALMKCYNPMPADSIEACLKRTCDNINAQNPSFIGQLGAGRINAFQALQCLTKKPKSDFIALDTFQCIGKSVRYAARSFGIPTLTYSWSFLGGSPASSTLANPLVTYSSNGYKSATLITCNSLGCDTITKTNLVNIDTPKASLIGRKYTSYNSNPVLITIKFTGNPPFSVTLTDGTNTWTQSNIKANPYFLSVVPKKDTSLISISAFSDSLCVGNRYGVDTIFRITLGGGGNPQYCETSYKFNGASNCVVKIDKQNGANWKDLYSTNGFTWECWFNLGNRNGASVTGVESLVGATDAQLCEDIGFHFNWPWSGSGKFNWVVSGQTNCSVPRGVVGTNMTFNANTWYHAVGVMNYATNTMQLYINGNLVNSGTLTIPMSQRMQNNVAVTIGNQDVNFNPYHTLTPFNGKIDEVRFWNSVRTASEIQSSYKSCLPASTANLVAYFKADEGTGTNTVSLVNGNFVGTLQNGASWDTQVDSVKNCTLCSYVSCKDSTIYYTDTSNWYYQNTSGNWVKASLGINNCGQHAHAWSPINLIGIQNANQMIWGSTASSTCNVKREINIPNVSIIDSIRVLVQADDNIVSFKVNGTHVTSTPFGWNNVSSVLINKSLLINGVNAFTIEGTNSGACAWVAMKMIIYKDSCGTSLPICDTAGLILCMSMDGNANDSTKYNHHGVTQGVSLTTGRNGNANSAYYFNGTTSYISLGVKPMLKPSKASISVWVKPHVFNSYIGGNANCILLTKNPNNPGSYMEAYSLYLTNRSGPTKFMTVSTHQPTTNEKWFQSVQNTTLNQWTHLVLTFDMDSLKLYINGQLDNKTFKGFTNVYDALDSIMLGYSANTTNKNYFKGDMDELKMYNRVLSNSEILNLYNKPFTCSCKAVQPPSDCDTTNLNTGKVLHLDFNGNTQDKSGNSNHATNFGATPVAGKAGVANTAYRFDGVNDYMQVSHATSLSPTSVTMTAIIKPRSFNADPCMGNEILTKGYDLPGGSGRYCMRYSPLVGNCTAFGDTILNNFYPVFKGFSGCATSVINDTPKVKTNRWYCLVMSYGNDTIKTYIDGILRHSCYFAGPLGSNTFDLFIGKHSHPAGTFPYWLSADIDEIRIYNRVLVPSEVKGYCGTCNVSPPQDCDTTNLNTGKVLHLDFNGNTQDKSGNSNHATNFGATPVAGKAGVANTAYKFNGTSNYMRVSNNTTINSMTKVTMCAILKPKGFYNGPCMNNQIMSKNNINNSGHYSLVYAPLNDNGACSALQDSNKCNFYSGISSSGCSVSTIYKAPFIKKDSWYCVVTTYDGDTAKNYVNGELRFTCKINLPLGSNSADLFIGKLDNITFPYWLNADVDDIRIYNRALAPSEVKGYCGTCNLPPPPSDCDTANLNTGLLVHLPFNGNTNDVSGNGNHATNFGATLTTDKKGNANSAYEFNNTYMTISTNTSLTNVQDSFTMCVNFMTTNVATHSNIFGWNSYINGSSYVMHAFSSWNGAGRVGYSFGNQPTMCNSSWVERNSMQTFAQNQWHCLVLVAKGGSIKFYVDDILIDSSYFSTFMPILGQCPNASLRLARWWSGDWQSFIGKLDDFRIYNRPLKRSEIKGYCGLCSIQPPPCDTSRRFTFTQCLNDSIQVIARAGSKYQWSPVSGLSNDTIRNPNVFVSNNQRYLVSYTSLKNCQLIDTIDVDVKAAAIYPKMEDQIICIGDSVQMTIPIYATNIVWSPNAAISSTSSKNPYFFPNSPRTYYLEFRDTFGCLHRDTFVVNSKVCCPARARFTIPKDLLCYGETLLVSNTSKGPITSYSWNFGSAIPNTFSSANPPSLTFPSGGSYTLRLIVTNGVCFDTMTKTVSIIQINPNAGKDTNNCLAAFTTQLGESPISDWTYKWMPTQYLNDATIADPICSIVNDSINYILEITDRNSGCKAFDTVVVYTNRTIDSTAQNLRICFGDSVLFNGIYRKTTNNYFYTIKKADGICDSFINLLRLNVLQKQIINYTDTSACEVYFDSKGRKHTISFSQYDTIKSKTILNCDSIIYFRNVKIYNKVYKDTTVAGCAPFRYNGKTYLVSKMKADSIRQRNVFMFDCDTIKYIHITVHPKPTAVITPSIPNPVLYKQTVTLSASGGQTYFWLQTSSNVPDIYYKINDIGPKLFTVRVTDENDCWDTVSYLVQGKLPEKCYYGFPNVFSPNEDNLNDEYLPNMDECTEVILFAIYDRWGEKVFETNQLKGWNGYFKGRPAPMGVYVYFAKLKTPWGIKEHQGSFTLIR
jgi:gliding motility-associated-like protein